MPKFNSVNVLDFLSENDVMFFIPVFQRHYRWGNVECKKFFLDIVRTAEKAQAQEEYAQHFLGLIYYDFHEQSHRFGDTKRYVLIDGQQRLTTVLLFLAAARDTTKNDKLKRYISDKYLIVSSCNQEENYAKIKLKQTPYDNTLYEKIMHGSKLSPQEKASPLYKNYAYFCKQLHVFQNIDSLLSNGLQNFYIGTARLTKGENPQEIYESLNSTGKGLDLSDLILNHLLLPVAPEKQEALYNQYWMPIENRLHAQTNEFFHDMMQMTVAHSLPASTPSNYKKLFDEFEFIYDNKDVSVLLPTFEYYSVIYNQMLNCDTPSVKINEALTKLFDLKRITSLYSFVMKLLACWYNQRLTESDVIDILDVLHNYYVRQLILGPLNGTLSKMVAKLPQYLDDNGVLLICTNKTNQMIEIMSSWPYVCRFPNDDEVYKAMQAESDWYHRSNLCRHILLLVECFLTNRSFFSNCTNIQIEHIMPQTLSSDWKQELGEAYAQVHKELIHSLGNLTLVTRNQELGNKSFAAKKEIYSHSTGLQIAQSHIVTCAKWNQNSIHERATWLAELLLTQIIPLPSTKRFSDNYINSDSSVLSLSDVGLVGQTICFSSQPDIIATVVSNSEVKYNNRLTSLASLTQKLLRSEGRNLNHNSSERYWEYNGCSVYSLTH